MVYPASTTALDNAMRETDTQALSLKSYASDKVAQLAAGTVSANVVLEILHRFREGIDVWTAAKSLTGIAQYVADEKNVAAGSIGADFNAMQAAAEAVRDEIIDTFPTANAPAAVSGRIAYQTLNSDGTITTAPFDQAQTAQLRTKLTAFIATVG